MKNHMYLLYFLYSYDRINIRYEINMTNIR